ncbi:MAG: methylhydantoinase [Rhodospirillaceae bacterium]|nr:methylhydantoinase [Rhodospirillaceae bacterium]|tara:strand:+ start:11845 stop:13935 length:2091 start_codon:yes stop_codon:yes gene_type:complete
MAKIGVDVGGTFTDLILEKGPRDVYVHKVPSTPEDQSLGVIRGITEICEIGQIARKEIELIVHGTTVATNITLENNGSEVGMLTSRGFRDILHIARHKRPYNFSLQFDVPWQSKPMVKRRNRIPITERVMPPNGKIVTPLNEKEVIEACKLFKQRDIEAVIICFMFSFLNSKHELLAKKIVQKELPGVYISTSCEVIDVIREYERFSTTAMNGYVGPKTSNYINNLANSLKKEGFKSELRIMQSNGGVATVDMTTEKPVTILMSGPAGGVIGGKWAGNLSKEKNIITVDIGGTSADISTIPNSEIRIMNPRDTYVGDYPILAPMIDLATIGAGGGSIAFIDKGGAFRVGPKSAGADPGPACYSKGGSEPTVTDAQVALGRLDVDRFLGGDMTINPDLSNKVIEKKLAKPLNMSVKDAALGIIKVINSNMALAIRANSVARGYDPRKFSLMPFGGAGPLHGVALANEVAAKEVIVPPAPGINAAIGLLETDMKYEFTRSAPLVLENATKKDFDRINRALSDLEKLCRERLSADGIIKKQQKIIRIAECRYHGQGFELRAELPNGKLNSNNKNIVINNFHKQHNLDYGYTFGSDQVEIMTLRVVGIASVKPMTWPKLKPLAKGKSNAKSLKDAFLYNRKTTFDDGKTVTCPRYNRDKLLAGQKISGPAIVIQHNSTTLIPPKHKAYVSTYGNIHIQKN